MTWLELAVLGTLVLAYCLPFLDLGTRRALPGNEAEVFQFLDWVLLNSVRQHGQFPLWNPYLQTGLPFVADPFLHVYNPLATVPVLLFGVPDGFKLGLFLSFLAACLGAWWLGAVLGLRPPIRVWAALMYAFTGPASARFFQGHYDFVLGFAWIPWVIAGLIAAMATRRRWQLVVAAISMALLFFSGNVYYAFYLLFVIALLGAVWIVDLGLDRSARVFRLVIHVDRAMALLASGALGLGLIAIQLVPMAELWPRIAKATTDVAESQTPWQVLLDYVSTDPYRPDAFSLLPAREEFYAYLGVGTVLALVPLPLAFRWRRPRRSLVFWCLLLAFTVVWINIRDMPWRDVYTGTYVLSQFRYPTRMLIYGALAIIFLAALTADALWSWLRDRLARRSAAWMGDARVLASCAGLALLAAWLAWSVLDVYLTNRQHIRTRDPYDVSYSLMRWLREFDRSEYFVSDRVGWHGSVVSNELRYFPAWYGFTLLLTPAPATERPIRARAHYLVLGNEGLPEERDARLVQRFESHTIYRLEDSLPFAFGVRDATLAHGASAGELRTEEVRALPARRSGPNELEVVASAEPGSTLVVLTTNYPGWQVRVDGHPRPLRSVGPYLAAEMLPGPHTYTFSFAPVSFFAGLAITLLASLVTLAVLVGARRPASLASAVVARARRWWVSARAGPRAWLPRPEKAMGETGNAAEGGARAAVAAPRGRGRVYEAVYEGGVLRLDQPLELPDQARVRITLESVASPPPPAGRLAPPFAATRGWFRRLPAVGLRLRAAAARLCLAVGLEWGLFGLALLVYSVTRLWALDQFPIFFFADEAIHVVLAEELIGRGLRDAQGNLLPLYFEAAGQRWTPLLSVYVHAVSVALFGKSLLVTRATSALVSVLGVAAVGLILRQVFRARLWWAGTLFMAIAPAWFLHSRTAFETVMMVSFYSCFLLFYLLYIMKSPRYIFIAMLFGAAAFYTYSNGQVIMGALGLLLLVADFRYHLRQWRTLVAALPLGLLLATPLLLFRLSHAEAMETHLRVLDSYWFRPFPLEQKLLQFAQLYGQALSPQYWFFPNTVDLARHRFDDAAHLPLLTLPLVLLGVGVCLRRFGSAPHRAIVLAALAAPASAVLVGVGITRVLGLVVIASLLATLGLEYVVSRVRLPGRQGLLGALLLASLSLLSLLTLRQALAEGPLWVRDYGLYGMQWGARQLFQDLLPRYLAQDLTVRILVSPTWANGADVFLRFFLSPEQRARTQMGNVDAFLANKRPLAGDMLFVMTREEYERARVSPKLQVVTVEEVLPYPDGSPGFFLARLAYVDNADAIFAAEREERRRPIQGEIQLYGQTVRVTHSRLGAGQLRDLFDGDRFTLVRGLEANPFVVELSFPEAQTFTGLGADFGSMDFTLSVFLTPTGADQPVVYTATYRGLKPDPHIEMTFEDPPPSVTAMRVEVLQLNAGDTAQIHVRELTPRRAW